MMPLVPFILAWPFGIWIASHFAIHMVALAAILGALRFNLAQPDFDRTSLATYNEQQKLVIVEGVIVGEPDARDADPTCASKPTSS